MKRKSTSVCITPVSEASFSRAGPNSSTKESPMIHSFIGSAAGVFPRGAGGGGRRGAGARPGAPARPRSGRWPGRGRPVRSPARGPPPRSGGRRWWWACVAGSSELEVDEGGDALGPEGVDDHEGEGERHALQHRAQAAEQGQAAFHGRAGNVLGGDAD